MQDAGATGPHGRGRSSEETPRMSRYQRVDRQRAGVLRLLHLRHRPRPWSSRSSSRLCNEAYAHRLAATFGEPTWLARSARSAQAPRRDTDRTQDSALPDPVRDGPGHVPDRGPADLRAGRRRRTDPAGLRVFQGPGGGRRAVEREFHLPGACTGRPPRVLHQLHPGRHAGAATSWPPRSSSRSPRCRRRPCCRGAGGSCSCSAPWWSWPAGGSGGPCTRARRSRRSASTTPLLRASPRVTPPPPFSTIPSKCCSPAGLSSPPGRCPDPNRLPTFYMDRVLQPGRWWATRSIASRCSGRAHSAPRR